MKYNFGFTLAEVVIVLGIVGVIAAMAVPSLISAYNRKFVENKLRSTYSLLANAVKMAENDGCSASAVTDGSSGWSPEKSKAVFEKCFQPYLKVTQVYSHDECVNLSKSYNSSRSDSSMYIDYNGYCYHLINGVALIVWAGRKDNASPVLISVQMRIRPAKEKQISGMDAFGVAIIDSNYGFVLSGPDMLGTAFSDEQLRDACSSVSGRIQLNGYHWGRDDFCTEIIKRNGWKIPKDYPLKF